MLNNISWQGYWTFIALTVSIYYAVILVKFYSKEINYFLVGGKARVLRISLSKKVENRQQFSGQSEITEYPSEKKKWGHDVEKDAPFVQSLLDEIQAYFDSLEGPLSKEELLMALRTLCSKHPFITGNRERLKIYQLIKELAQVTCGLHFSEEMLGVLWTGH